MLLLMAGGGLPAAAQQCGWEWVNPHPPRIDIHRLKHEVGAFVGVGVSGTIIRSTSGFSWTRENSGVTADLYGVDWGAGTFVAVGDGVILTSPTGLDWTIVDGGAGWRLLDVEYSASRFVAVGHGLGGQVLTSIVGDEWELAPAPWSGEADSIAGSDGGFFVAVGTEIWSSPDGLQWQLEISVPASVALAAVAESGKKTGSSLFELDRIDLAWTGSRLFWAGGDQLWSAEPGGWAWRLDATLGGCYPFGDWLGLASGSGWVVASGISGCPSPYLTPTVTLLISVDGGASFRPPWQTELGGFPALARYGSRWVAAGAYGDVVTSSDGVSWDCGGAGCTSLACDDGFVDLAHGETGWLAAGGVGVCDDQLKRIGGATTAVSPDGMAWQVRPLTADRFRGAAATEDGFVAVGDGWIARSSDGLNWSRTASPDGAVLRGVAAGDGTEVVAGPGGALYVGDGGPSWFKPYLFVTDDLHRVVWGDDQFLAFGANGMVLRSTDHMNWTTVPVATRVDLLGAAAGPEGWIMVGDEGVILGGSDGRFWSTRRSAVDARLNDVAWGDGRYVAVGWDEAPDGTRPAVILASGGGIHWTRFPAPEEALYRVGWTGDGWIVAGADRTLMRTDCIGVMMEPEAEHLQVPVDRSVELVVHLSSPARSDGEMTLRSSRPGRVAVPATAPFLAGADRVVVPVSGVEIEQGAVLTLGLPDELGGGTTTVLVSVQPPEWTPRAPSGRVAP
ncbi:MAG: hypothetical protein V2I67_17775 [Thermoanaerobaculales bacterium]|jgi:hypothetical protein|nr:hypothetical protein [Thermoanaerobaculales bacterium]